MVPCFPLSERHHYHHHKPESARYPASEHVEVTYDGSSWHVDSLVDLGLAAMPMDPQWDYRYPHRFEYPDEHRICTRERWERFFRPDPSGGRWVVLFIDYSNSSSHSTKPFSFSVWHFPSQTQQQQSQQGDEVQEESVLSDASHFPPASSTMFEGRRDWNLRHVEAFRRAVRAASDEKFDSRYGEKQVHLQILGTHPDHQRRGAAPTLLRYGIQQARENNLPIMLHASPMGQPLYASFGFEDRGKVFVQLYGEEDKVTLDAMALEVAK